MEHALLERRVQTLVKLNPALAEAATLQKTIITVLYAATAPIRPIVLPLRRAREKLSGGVPLLHGESVFLDDGFIRDVFGRLVNVLRSRADTAEKAGQLAEAAYEHRLHVEHAVAEAFVNHPEHLDQVAIEAGVSPELLQMLAQLSARPILKAYAEHVAPALQAGRDDWDRGYCPMCGAWPGLAELRGAEQLRHLRCLRCGADWTITRLRCPFCGNDHHDALGYLQAEGERRFRVDVCRGCGGYLKAGSSFDAAPTELLALDDLASVHLDIAALERGQQRPPEPGFRLELVDGEDDLDDD